MDSGDTVLGGFYLFAPKMAYGVSNLVGDKSHIIQCDIDV